MNSLEKLQVYKMMGTKKGAYKVQAPLRLTLNPKCLVGTGLRQQGKNMLITRKNQRGAAALGSITKSATTTVCKYELLDLAGRVYGENSRVAKCQRIPSYGVQNLGDSRGISKNEKGKASYHGVGSCGDVWTCPVCSKRIAEQRRQDIQKAMSAHRKAHPANKCFLLTRTFRHSRTDDFALTMKRLRKASSGMKACRAYRDLMKDLDCVGTIRAFELTHSEANGWHPHYHEILFVSGEFSQEKLKRIESGLYKVWRRYCEKNELGAPTRKHGLRLDYRNDGIDAVGAYVTKFGYELTYAHTKKSKKAGRSPMRILLDIYQDEKKGKFHFRDWALLREYADKIKGTAQLYWSPGLKDRYGIVTESDEVIADKPEKFHFLNLTSEQWAAILHLKKRAQVLHLATACPVPGPVLKYIDELVDKSKKERLEIVARRMELRRSISESSAEIIERLRA